MPNLRCDCTSASELRPTQLAGGLHAQACGDCGSALIELEAYERWLDREPLAKAAADVAVHDHAAVRACPRCSRLMQRLRVGAQPDFRLDRCAGCGLLWLDRGEWEALRASGLAPQLTRLLSDRGQRDIQEQQLRLRREATLRQKHGDACMDELARVRQWLAQQDHREELLALLRSGW